MRWLAMFLCTACEPNRHGRSGKWILNPSTTTTHRKHSKLHNAQLFQKKHQTHRTPPTYLASRPSEPQPNLKLTSRKAGIVDRRPAPKPSSSSVDTDSTPRSGSRACRKLHTLHLVAQKLTAWTHTNKPTANTNCNLYQRKHAKTKMSEAHAPQVRRLTLFPLFPVGVCPSIADPHYTYHLTMARYISNSEASKLVMQMYM